jgi:hypothetical protein
MIVTVAILMSSCGVVRSHRARAHVCSGQKLCMYNFSSITRPIIRERKIGCGKKVQGGNE